MEGDLRLGKNGWGHIAVQDKRESLKEYIKLNQQDFYRLAFSYTKNSDAALDVVQESIVKAIDKIGSLKDTAYLKTWFYRILVNESLMHLRRSKRLVLVESIEDGEPGCGEDLAQSMDMYNAIQALEVKIRTVIILRFFEDMKLEEIAVITKTNLSTVKSRLYKGLELLKVSIGEE